MNWYNHARTPRSAQASLSMCGAFFSQPSSLMRKGGQRVLGDGALTATPESNTTTARQIKKAAENETPLKTRS